MNKAYRHVYKDGIGWVAVAENASCKSKLSSKKNRILNAMTADFSYMKKLSFATIAAMLMGGGIVVPTNLFAGKTYFLNDKGKQESNDPKSYINTQKQVIGMINYTDEKIPEGQKEALKKTNQSVFIGNEIAVGQNEFYGAVAIGGDDTFVNSKINDYFESSFKEIIPIITYESFGKLKDTSWSKTAVGDHGATAIGSHAQAQKKYSIAMGTYNFSSGEKSISIGTVNWAGTNKSIAFGTNNYIYNGGENSMAFGHKNEVTGADSVAIGLNNKITDKNSFVFGNGSEAKSGNNYPAIAIGYQSKANFDNTISMGYKAEAKAYTAISIGEETKAGHQSIAIGRMADASPDTPYEPEKSKIPPKSDAIAVGNEAKAKVESAVAVGNKAEVKEKDGIALGSYSLADRKALVEEADKKAVYLGNDENVLKTLKSTKAAVSFGKAGDDGFTRQIMGVAAGKEDFDAVNVAQLKGAMSNVNKILGSTLNPNGTITAPKFNAFKNDPNKTYADAINANTDRLDKFDKDGFFKVSKLGDATKNPIKPDGEVKFDAGDNINVEVKANNDKGADIKYSLNPELKNIKSIEGTGGKKIDLSKDNIDFGGSKLTNIADATDNNDAVTFKQLQEMKKNPNNKADLTSESPVAFVIKDKDGHLVQLGRDKDTSDNKVKFYKLKDDGSKEYISDGNGKFSDAAKTLGLGNKGDEIKGINISTINPATGKVVGATKFINVADGEIATNSTEVVNGGQLHKIVEDGFSTKTNLKVNDGTASETAKHKLGSTIGITGKSTQSIDKLSGENLATATDKDGNIHLLMSKDSRFNSINVGGKDGEPNSGIKISQGKDGENGVKTLKFGDDNSKIRLGNLAEGKDENDAVTVKQLEELKNLAAGNTISNNIANKLIGGKVKDSDGNVITDKDGKDIEYVDDKGDLTPEGKEALTTNTATGKKVQNTNIIQAINNINKQGTKFFHVNDGTEPVGKPIDGNDNDAKAKAIGSTAIGMNAVVTDKAPNGVALGSDSVANRLTSLDGYIPKGADVDQEKAIKDTIKAGNDGKMQGVISVGKFDKDGNLLTSRQITGVAAGKEDSDAVNVAQLKAVAHNAGWISSNDKRYDKNGKVVDNDIPAKAEGINSVAIGAGSNTKVVSADGKISHRNNTVSVGGVNPDGTINTRTISNVAPGELDSDVATMGQLRSGLNNVYNKLGEYKKRASAGTASAMAIGNMPQSTIPGKGMVSLGSGFYDGQSAMAIGLSKMSDDGKWVVKGSASYDSQEKAGAALSVGFHF